MSNDKRLLFGSDFGTGESALHFLSNQNFHEASLIVWQPSTAFGEVHPQQHGRAVASRAREYPPSFPTYLVLGYLRLIMLKVKRTPTWRACHRALWVGRLRALLCVCKVLAICLAA